MATPQSLLAGFFEWPCLVVVGDDAVVVALFRVGVAAEGIGDHRAVSWRLAGLDQGVATSDRNIGGDQAVRTSLRGESSSTSRRAEDKSEPKKMGGRGSGRQTNHGFMVDKCHEFKSIDIAWLHRQKLMQMGRTSTITWSVRGQQTGSIGIARLPGGIRLSYRQRSHGEEWRDVADFIPVVETATHFGGRRLWFQCLSCHSRCRILYGGALFRCRRCQNLKYDTQYEPPFARAATRALKIRDRLGGKGGIDDLFPPKPKGMHWKTYERLQAREERLQEAWAVGIARKFRMFERGEA